MKPLLLYIFLIMAITLEAALILDDFPISGYRNFDDGLITRDFASSIWMSDAYINTLDYYASDAYTLSNVYSYGNAVRCIKD